MPCDILIVDDDDRVRTAFVWFFEQGGHAVRVACDGDDALAEMRRAPPALVLLDEHMPRLPGPQVLAAMASDARLAQIPVVLIGALARQGATTPQVVAVREKASDIPALVALARQYCGCG